MTKTKTKLRIAAAMLAVLLLTCAWVGAVSAADEVAFSYGADDELTKIWKTGSTYWTAKDVTGNVKIPVKLVIDGASATPWMSGYHVGITIKESGVTPLATSKYTLSNLIPQWGDDAQIYNDGKIASGIGTHTNAAMIELTSTPQNLFSIDIPTTELEKGTYTTSFDPSVKTVALSAALSSVIDTTGVSSGSQTTTPEFSFYVREKLPKVGVFTISGYDGTFANDVSVTVFRKGGASTTETITGAADSSYKSVYDTLTWSPASGDVSVTGTSDLSATLTLVHIASDANSAQTDVSAEINTGLTDASDKTTIKVTSTPWLISAKDNYNAANNDYKATTYYTQYSSKRIGIKGDLTSTTPRTLGTYWNFATPRKIEYTVSAAQKLSTTTEWDSLIPVSLLWTGGAEKTELTADVTFVSDATDYVTGKSLGNTFTVTTDTLTSHTSDTRVTLTYTGYPLGDANTDGGVNIVDSAVIGIQIIKSVEINPLDTTGLLSNFLSAEQKIYADCGSATPDGKITVADILAINKFIVGYTSPWSSTP